jgi:predicted metal-binding protein
LSYRAGIEAAGQGDRTKKDAMTDPKTLEALIRKHGYSDFRWIDPKEIVVAQWVRMKCRFGCPDYGQNACCP